MEPSGRYQWHRPANETARNRLKQANSQPAATHGNGSRRHGKEGVNGSSPLEGSAKAPHVGAFAFMSTSRFSRVPSRPALPPLSEVANGAML
jgi:hypothetical protein